MEFRSYQRLIHIYIGDRFYWDGVYPGIYTVTRLGDRGIFVIKDGDNEEVEWCSDSVALGLHKKINN